jgi:hypothetical protein
MDPEAAATDLNVGNLDRLVRIVGGLALIAAATLGLLGSWAFLGVIPLATGLVAWCPVYRALGVRSTAR